MTALILLSALTQPSAACDRPHSGPASDGESRPPVAALPPSGTASLSPAVFPVHEKVTFTYTYTVGPAGLSAGDGVRLEDPEFHGMRWAKWGFLTTNPANCSPFTAEETEASGGLITVDHTGDGSVALQSFRVTETPEIHSYGFTEVTVREGSLAPGETVVFTLGDLRGGSECGIQTAPRAMDSVPFIILEQLGGGDWVELDAPTFSFVSEGPAERLLVSAPSQAQTGETFTVRVAALDILGNAYRDATLSLSASLDGEPLGEHTLTPADEGIWTFETRVDAEGFARIEVDGGLLSATSNPVLVADELPARGVYWGDIHTHHGHSFTDEGGALRDQNHDYGRDVIGLQVGCESLKSSPHELSWDEIWPDLQQACEDYTADGEYVALLCYEWMGNENSPGTEGHHNVYYDDCDGELAPNTLTGLTGSDIALWAFMAEAEATTGSRSLSVPHASNSTGYNWRDRDDAARPLAEVYSEWGVSATAEPDGSGVYNGLGAGHRLGLFAASDNHDGWIGNRWAAYLAAGGLGAFVATDLSREGVFEAMSERSTYGSSGHRPYLSFGADDGADVLMGWEYIADAPTFQWVYAGEAAIETVELLSIALDDPSASTLTVLESWSPGTLEAEEEHALSWDGTPIAVWLHVVEADGEEAWSSPIWLTDDCDAAGVEDPAGRCDEDTGDGGETGETGDGGDDTSPLDTDAQETGDGGSDGDGGDGEGCGGCGKSSGSAFFLLLPGLLLLRRRQ